MRGYAICRLILCTYITCLTVGVVGCSDSDGPVKTPISTPIISPTGQFPLLPTAPSADPFGTIDFNEDATQDLGGEDDEDGADSDDDVTVNKNADAAAPAACDVFVPCEDGFACVSGECVEDTTPPAPAETSTSEAGTVPDATPPTFISPPASLGEDCSQDTTHCSEDFLCQPCVAGLVCNAKHQCALPSAGDAGDSCTSPAGTAEESLCGPGLTCEESLTTTGATEHRCAKYLSQGSGGSCNPDAGLLCNASKNLICVQNPDINPATLTNLAEFGRCQKRASLNDACHHAPPACTKANKRDCFAVAPPCFDDLVCTSEFTGVQGKCITPCTANDGSEHYAKAPAGRQTVPLVVELFEHSNFTGHRAVVADDIGFFRNKTAFVDLLKAEYGPECSFVTWEESKPGYAVCTNHSVKPAPQGGEATYQFSVTLDDYPILPEKIHNAVSSIRVRKGPHYTATGGGDRVAFFDNPFATGAPILTMGPGEQIGLDALNDKISAVRILRGTYTDYCGESPSDGQYSTNRWTKPIWTVVTVVSGPIKNPVTGKPEDRRTHLIEDTADLHTYMMGGNSLQFDIQSGPDIGIGAPTVIFYEKASYGGTPQQTCVPVGPIRSLKILPPSGNP